jgi:hypothetical protein
MAITPVADALFSMDWFEQAVRLAKHAPEELLDLHLAHLVVYDRQGAEIAAHKRQRALEAARIVTKAANDSPAPATGVTQEAIEAIVAGIAPVLKHEFDTLRRQIAALETANAKLQGRVLDLEATNAARAERAVR